MATVLVWQRTDLSKIDLTKTLLEFSPIFAFKMKELFPKCSRAAKLVFTKPTLREIDAFQNLEDVIQKRIDQLQAFYELQKESSMTI